LICLGNCFYPHLAQTFFNFLKYGTTFYFLFVFFSNTLAAQEKQPVIEFSGAYTFDLASNLYGGVKQGNAYLGNVYLNFDFETERLNLWNRGHFFVYLLNNHGNSLSELMGDYQVANNIEAESHTRLYEIWYEHNFDFWSILIGQHNLNSVFAISETGLFFINNSFGIQPDLSTNFSASIFPLATLGGVISWRIWDRFKLHHAIYDGDPGTESNNPNSLNWKISKEEGALLINEIQYTTQKDSLQQSTFKFGYWRHIQERVVDQVSYSNSQGVYFINDHIVCRDKTSGGTLSAFSQLGFSLNEHNPVKAYLSGGLLYKGISHRRIDDGIGLAIGHTYFSDSYQSNFKKGLKNETAIEISYQWITKGRWTFQPNVQYILNPGSNSQLPNALMGLIRFGLYW